MKMRLSATSVTARRIIPPQCPSLIEGAARVAMLLAAVWVVLQMPLSCIGTTRGKVTKKSIAADASEYQITIEGDGSSLQAPYRRNFFDQVRIGDEITYRPLFFHSLRREGHSVAVSFEPELYFSIGVIAVGALSLALTCVSGPSWINWIAWTLAATISVVIIGGSVVALLLPSG